MTLDGKRIAISDYIGKRLLLAFFNPGVPAAAPGAEAVQAVAGLATSHNFEVIGVSVGSTRTAAREFARKHHLGFPIIDDSTGRISRRLGLQSPVTIVAADAEGYMVFGTSVAAPRSGASTPEAERVEDSLRKALRLPARQDESLAFGER